MTHRIVDKDFDYQGRELWYRAEVAYLYSYTPETSDSPAEEDYQADINVLEVSEYVELDEGRGYREETLYFDSLPEALREAIEADALLSAREEG